MGGYEKIPARHWPTWNEWVDRISPFIQGGASLKTKEEIDINRNYAMLPE